MTETLEKEETKQEEEKLVENLKKNYMRRSSIV